MFSNFNLLGLLGIVGGAALTWWAFIRPAFTYTYRLDSEASKRLLVKVMNESNWKYVIMDNLVVPPKLPDVFEAFVSLEGCQFFFTRAERLMTAGWKGKDNVSSVTCLRWQRAKLQKLLGQASNGVTIPIYSLMPGSDGRDKLGELIYDENVQVFLPRGKYEDIEQEVKNVLDGVKKKTGMLLYGPPGSGKTQFVKYLSRKYGIPVNVVYFNPEYNNHDIAMMFANLPQKSILLMEDFDTIFNGRECAMKNDQVRFTFDSIINALDGVHNDYIGNIFVMTANDIDRIDPSLRDRPSRFKFVRDFGLPDFEVRLRILGDEKLAQETEGCTLDQVFSKKQIE